MRNVADRFFEFSEHTLGGTHSHLTHAVSTQKDQVPE